MSVIFITHDQPPKVLEPVDGTLDFPATAKTRISGIFVRKGLESVIPSGHLADPAEDERDCLCIFTECPIG